MKLKTVAVAALASAIAGAAHAQALETGPCSRMNQLLASKPARSHFKNEYDGVYRFKNATSKCGATSLRTLALTYTSGDGNSFVYNVAGTEYKIEPNSADCSKAELWANDIVGTFTVTQRVASRGDGYCDLFVEGAWNLRQATGAWTWTTTFKMIVLDDQHFAFGRTGTGAIFIAR